jgi:pyruvate dehydrogenase E2 component (dihydrolipoamide acetyltransferase)
MTELTMPKLSDSMEQGTILTWLKTDGEPVRAGEDLLEIETDKATVTHQADVDGILEIIAPEGATLPVGAPIARVGAAREPETPPTEAGGSELPSPIEAPAEPTGAETNGGASAADLATHGRAAERVSASKRATPLARRVAKAHGVALDAIIGTGPLGRVTRVDVLSKAGVTVERTRLPPARTTTPSEPVATGDALASSGKGMVDVVDPTRLQSLVARRMAEAKATIPHFQVQTEVVIDALLAFRAQIKDAGEPTPSLNDLIIKASALALRKHPRANSSYRDGRFEFYSRVNVGIAVAAEGALVVPTIFDADQKSVGQIAAESRQLAARVRDGAISPADLSGATFTVSNLGMYGMTAIVPVVNPPQSVILGVGAAREVLARVDGEIIDRHLMTLTVSCDHRILYGADAAELLSAIRELLEKPVKLVL